MKTPNPQNPSAKEAKEGLSLFCRKYDLILGYSFFKAMESFKVSNQYNAPNKTVDIYYAGPTDEQLDAVLLHFRFLIIHNERSSVWWYKSNFCALEKDPSEIQKVDEAFSALNIWRENPARVSHFKNRDLLAALIYGERVHANEQKWIDEYSAIMRDQILSALNTALASELVFGFISRVHPLYRMAQDILRAHAIVTKI